MNAEPEVLRMIREGARGQHAADCDGSGRCRCGRAFENLTDAEWRQITPRQPDDQVRLVGFESPAIPEEAGA